MSAPSPLDALRELSQDFPKYSAALSRRVPVPDDIARKAEIMARRGADPLAIYINGKSYSHPELNAYT
jgi:UDP-glucose:glycoprotein glucosyltransferase